MVEMQETVVNILFLAFLNTFEAVNCRQTIIWHAKKSKVVLALDFW